MVNGIDTRDLLRKDAFNLTEDEKNVLKNVLGFEKTETIYNKDSSDSNLNWGYTNGISDNSWKILSNLTTFDLSKYKRLRCCYYTGSEGTSQTFEVDLNHAQQGSYYGFNINFSTYWPTRTRCMISLDKKQIIFGFFNSSGNADNNMGYYYKLEGIY